VTSYAEQSPWVLVIHGQVAKTGLPAQNESNSLQASFDSILHCLTTAKPSKVKRLALSFDGAVRFIPEKYQQRITEFYTIWLIFKKTPALASAEALNSMYT
jgi:hypothetical protein